MSKNTDNNKPSPKKVTEKSTPIVTKPKSDKTVEKASDDSEIDLPEV